MFANSLENSFVFALSCAWISRPMTTSHPSFAFEYALRHGPQVRAVDLVAVAVNLVTHMLRDLMRQCRSLGVPSHPAQIQTRIRNIPLWSVVAASEMKRWSSGEKPTTSSLSCLAQALKLTDGPTANPSNLHPWLTGMQVSRTPVPQCPIIT